PADPRLRHHLPRGVGREAAHRARGGHHDRVTSGLGHGAARGAAWRRPSRSGTGGGALMADTVTAAGVDAGDHGGHGEHESLGVDNRKLGMWLFLSSEFLFFGALITNYMVYGNDTFGSSVVPREIYDIPFTSVSSFVLLMSSL